MSRVYVHVRPHERLDLTSHLTGSRRGQSRAAVASTFTIWVANAQAELVAGTTITTVDPEAAASVGAIGLAAVPLVCCSCSVAWGMLRRGSMTVESIGPYLLWAE